MGRKLAAKYLCQVYGFRIGWQQLAKLAMRGNGPAYSTNGYNSIYARAELDRYARSRLSPAAHTVAEHFVREEQARKSELVANNGHVKRSKIEGNNLNKLERARAT